MPGFRRWGKSKFQKNPESSFKLLAAVLVITFYLIIKEFSHPTFRQDTRIATFGAHIQYTEWQNGTERADVEKADKVREAMKHTFWKYRHNAWGQDAIKPVTGANDSSRNAWGAFIVDASTTLALMGLWEELAECVRFIVEIDFSTAHGLVDPSEATTRYLGALTSLVDLSEAGIIPGSVLDMETRVKILQQAVALADNLGPAYDTPTGMPWPRVNFRTGRGVPGPPEVYLEDPDQSRYDGPAISPARGGSAILENRVLSRMTGNNIYAKNATLAWAPLVWSNYTATWSGMIDAPINIMTGEPVGRQRHWDAGHDAYYEYLLKMTLLAPRSDPHLAVYKRRFVDSAYSLRGSLATRSTPVSDHLMQHLFLGMQDRRWYLNRQSHAACAAPGVLLLAAKLYDEPALRTFALALLEGCHHTYASTPSKIGPETWSWIPNRVTTESQAFQTETGREDKELKAHGFWAVDGRYRGRPEYLESLFYAWRITGQQRYRDWAWEAFLAMETHCRAPFGYAQLADVGRVKEEEWSGKGEGRWIDKQESYWAAETLKYAYLVFSGVDVASLDQWVFSAGGHVFRMIR
ncbi:mannosyl-oligosaccharide alpha-1,2-mannosidase-like protein [Westerdykella ornata]|uniref:alpha-1,2-Mannosidase n=1 Tax=Westerdykella ornata TaxID=318751 RepID=A0A6A6JLG0_WESOR|nr:mannosyl-oligosaccharide alpha-1,2-mannosidase-like protein [Westerdykella ornata]KAF2275749.1 mannosyl-oligosaccharide alpha-1,2-mannosidase-like protein [Westerdykella ornata]